MQIYRDLFNIEGLKLVYIIQSNIIRISSSLSPFSFPPVAV